MYTLIKRPELKLVNCCQHIAIKHNDLARYIVVLHVCLLEARILLYHALATILCYCRVQGCCGIRFFTCCLGVHAVTLGQV